MREQIDPVLQSEPGLSLIHNQEACRPTEKQLTVTSLLPHPHAVSVHISNACLAVFGEETGLQTEKWCSISLPSQAAD